MAFEKGDIVVLNPDHKLNKAYLSDRIKRMLADNIPATVVETFVEEGTAYLRIEVEIDNIIQRATFYAVRMMPLIQDIVEGCFVRCVDIRRSSVLAKDAVYKVLALVEKDGKKFIRVASQRREIRHSFPVEMFTFKSKNPPKEWGEAVVENWEEKLLNDLAGGVHTGICSFAIMFDNDKVAFTRNGPCHAQFSAVYDDHGRQKVKAVALCFSRFYEKMDDKRKEGYKAFLNYLVNESPLKDCFIPRKPDDLVRNGVMMNINKSVDELATAAIASRHYTEYTKFGELFDEVMELGFDGNVAMFVSTFFTRAGDTLTYSNFGGGHHFLANTMDYKSLFQFFKGGFQPENLPNPYKPMAEGRKAYQIHKTVAKVAMDKNWNPTAGGVVDWVKGLKIVEKAKAGDFGGNVLKVTGKNSLIRLCAAVYKEV